MSIFPGLPTIPATTFSPILINIGVFQVNSVSYNSSIAMRDVLYGDVFGYHKNNQGFGAVWGNANTIPANMNIVVDPDIYDQNGCQNQFKVTTREN